MSKKGRKSENSIDKIDIEILNLLQEYPSITFSDVAKKVDKSQPAVGMRITKLKHEGLTKRYELNHTKLKENFGIALAFVRFSSDDISKTSKKFSGCPYILNVFNITGAFNCLAQVVAANMEKVQHIVNTCIQSKKGEIAAIIEYVIKSAKDFYYNIDMELITNSGYDCHRECGERISRAEFNKLNKSNI